MIRTWRIVIRQLRWTDCALFVAFSYQNFHVIGDNLLPPCPHLANLSEVRWGGPMSDPT